MREVAILAGVILFAGCSSRELIPLSQSGGGVCHVALTDPDELSKLQALDNAENTSIKITFPVKDQLITADSFTVKYKLDNYTVSEGGKNVGQHVHVIVDNFPYEADYSPDGSITFDSNKLKPGKHVVCVFPARKFHLSLKGPNCFASVTFYYKEKKEDPVPDAGTPWLIYSRPKGEYKKSDGGAANIMLDFYLRNVKLSPEGYKVIATAEKDGKEIVKMILAEWKPVILLKDPEVGEYKITLTLVDAGGRPVQVPFNPTSRTIKISP